MDVELLDNETRVPMFSYRYRIGFHIFQKCYLAYEKGKVQTYAPINIWQS